jgi:hypothetical protein
LSYLMRAEISPDIWIYVDYPITVGVTLNFADEAHPRIHIMPEEASEDAKMRAFAVAIMLRSQMRFCARTGRGDEFSVYHSDVEAINACPVMLVSVFSYPNDVSWIERQSPLPPPEHGTAALINDKLYNISDLPEQAQERQEQISQMITGMPTQIIETPDAFEYQYPICTEELRAMMQQLAQDYYAFHQEATQEQTSKPRAKTNLPRAINPFEKGNAATSTCLAMQLLAQATQNAIGGRSRWKNPKDHPPYYSHDGNIIEYRGNSKIFTDEIIGSLWEQVGQQSYGVMDMAAFMVAAFARSAEPDHAAWIYSEKFRESRGLSKMQKAVTDEIKRDAGYRQENYEEVQQCVAHIERIWMTISQDINEQEYNPKTKKRKQRKLTYKGRFAVVKGSLTQKDLGTTDSETSIEVAWHMAPGDWLAPFLEYPNRQIANLSDRVLRYNPRTQGWEKSLGYYFFFHGHMNSIRGGHTFNRYIETLLKDCSLDGKVERDRPQRTFDRFKKAMDKLTEDGLINGWRYTDHKGGYIPTKRSWIDEWLGLRITIEIAPNKYQLS